MHESMSILGLAKLVREMRRAQTGDSQLGRQPENIFALVNLIQDLEDRVDATVKEVLGPDGIDVDGPANVDTAAPAPTPASAPSVPSTPTSPPPLLGHQELLAACRHARGYFVAHAAVEREVNDRPDRAEHFEHHARVMDLAIAKAEGTEPLLVTQKRKKGDQTS